MQSFHLRERSINVFKTSADKRYAGMEPHVANNKRKRTKRTWLLTRKKEKNSPACLKIQVRKNHSKHSPRTCEAHKPTAAKILQAFRKQATQNIRQRMNKKVEHNKIFVISIQLHVSTSRSLHQASVRTF